MEMLLQGMFIGLSLSLLAGPILFLLLQTGIKQGFRAGITVGAGEWVSDLGYILLSSFAINKVLYYSQQTYFTKSLGVIGALLLMGFGLSSWVKKTAHMPSSGIIEKKSYGKLFLKGFSINTFNPFTLFFWLGISSTIALQMQREGVSGLPFYTGILLTIVVLDIAKVYSAKKLRPLLTQNRLLLAQKVVGLFLFLFGLALGSRTLLVS
jgi:threonine/homoserine/homoserine lactone efflux protein